MADFLDFLPLYQESASTVRARMDADVNSGLTQDDENWIDTREGSFYYDVTQPFVLEAARLWDAIGSEVPAAALVVYAWGVYLDAHAAIFEIERKAAAYASGEVLFSGDAGVLVPTGTIVSAEPIDEDGDAIEFETIESGTTGAKLVQPEFSSSSVLTTGGTLTPGTYYYRVTAYNAFGETLGSAATTKVIANSTSAATFDWPDIAGATGYRLYRSTQPDGLNGVIVYDGAASTATDAGAVGTGNGPPPIDTSAGVRLDVRALVAGTQGNVAARGVDTLETPNPGITVVVNELPMGGGAEVESDDALRIRVLGRYKGQGGGNVADYEQWSLEFEGVGRVFVGPVALGPGTVQIVAMEEDGDPVGPSTVTGLQAHLDPIAGQGKGRAPVGHAVTVQTPSVRLIDVVATLSFEDGFSLDGGGGTTPLRARIVQALSDYVDQLDVGEDVIFEHVKARFFDVDGVYNVASVTVEGGTADVAIASVPAEVASLATPVLT